MNIITDKPYMVFRKDGQYGAMYSVGLSKKDQNGKYINGYMACKFRKDEVVEDKTKIYLRDAWMDFYLTKDGKTVTYLFINKYATVEEVIEKSKEETQERDLFKEFGEEINITADQLPF